MVRLNGLKLARMKAGLRQIDLAMTLGVSESLITKWETGRIKPSRDLQDELAQVLNTELQELFPEAAEDGG